jgi:hypothetical protein
VWISKEGDYVDAVAQPGQSGIRVVIEDIFRSFRTFRGLEVPDLVHPAPGLLIDPAVKGGTPVAEGTRVTYDRLAGLRRDGLSVARFVNCIRGSQRSPLRAQPDSRIVLRNLPEWHEGSAG